MTSAEYNPVTRGLQNPTRKNAINAKCAECMGCTSALQGDRYADHLEPGFRTLIAECSAPSCPLWTWRPYQKGRQS